MAKVSVSVEGVEAVIKPFDAILNANERGTIIPKAIRAVAKVVQKAARQTVPQPGYPGDKPGLKPLRDTIAIKVIEYSRAKVAIVSPQWPAGAHGWNVEFGHRIVSRGGARRNRQTDPTGFFPTGGGGEEGGQTTPSLYMERAIAISAGEQQRVFDEAVTAAVQSLFSR